MILSKSKTILILLVLTLLAISIISAIVVDNDVAVNEIQDCTTEFYDATEDVFDYVTRERNVYETCIYYLNSTVCDDEPLNTSCYTNTTEIEQKCVIGKEPYESYEKVAEKVVQKNRTICNVIGYKINNKIINCSKYGYGCDNKGTEVCIWNCLDGDCISKLDFNYVKSRINDDEIGGWSGKCFDIKDKDWHKVKMKLDSPKFKDIVIEDE